VSHHESGIEVRVVLRQGAAPDTLERVRSGMLAQLEAAGALPPPVSVAEATQLEREPGPEAKFRLVKSTVGAARRAG
jgi:hypothetical protein